jgi:hypothetical protein
MEVDGIGKDDMEYEGGDVRGHLFFSPSPPSHSVSSPPILPTSIASTHIIPQCH